jgi:UDP-GlcNAc:undecaprenyl-phosphate GlcNAc-1-phosphate transferase
MFITMALIPIFRTLALKLNIMDFPKERKVHPSPMPKLGGIAMALGILIPVVLWADGGRFMKAVLIGAGIVVVLGLIDDFKEIGYKTKFGGQMAAALVVVFYGGLKICHLGACLPQNMLVPDVLAIPLTLLAIVGVTNAINLSDGLDGLAGGTTLLIFICIGYLAFTGLYRPEGFFIAVLSLAVIGAILGFLRFNTYPATIFMGDSGSQLLGFLAITLSIGLTQGSSSPLSPFFPLLLLGFPVLDTLTVMSERISNGRSPFAADKNHFHHKLMRLGLYHTDAVVTIYLVTAFLVSTAFVFRFYSEWFLLVFYLVFAGIFVGGFLAADRYGWKLQRYDLIQRLLKDRLRVLKEKNVLIKVAFHVVEFAVPGLLIMTCLLPAEVPAYISWIFAAFAVMTAATWIFMKPWLIGMLRIAFYLMVPLIIRLGQMNPAAWMNARAMLLYNLSFLGLTLFVVLTLKFTWRTTGFKASPLEYLVLVIALVVPNLPDPMIQSLHMGFLAVKIIVFYFSFEVLVGELRGQLTRPAVAVIAALLLVAVKGLF